MNSELFGVEDVETPAAAAAFFLLCNNKFENAYFTEKNQSCFCGPKSRIFDVGSRSYFISMNDYISRLEHTRLPVNSVFVKMQH